MSEKLYSGSHTGLHWDVKVDFRRVTARLRRQNDAYYGIV